MIQEKKELIDRVKLHQLIIQKMKELNQTDILSASLSLREFVEILSEIPNQDELGAVWILDGSVWRCSWCKMSALESFGKSFPSKHCPYCGRRMKMEGSNGS